MFPGFADKFLQVVYRVTEHTDAMLTYWDNQLICRLANHAYISWFGVAPKLMIDKMAEPRDIVRYSF